METVIISCVNNIIAYVAGKCEDYMHDFVSVHIIMNDYRVSYPLSTGSYSRTP